MSTRLIEDEVSMNAGFRLFTAARNVPDVRCHKAYIHGLRPRWTLWELQPTRQRTR